MADLIDRHALIDEISKYHITSGITAQATWNECVDIIIETLESFPSTNNTGKWLNHYSPYTCEHCGFHVDSKTRYCPDCGRRASNYE